MAAVWLAIVALLAVATGCSGGETDPPAPLNPEPCQLPNRMVGERCLAPGVADDGCPAGTLGQADGNCRPAGLLPEDCAEGFVHVPFDTPPDDPLAGGGWCEPILPAAPCSPGLMAVPGDTACRPVMDCGSGKWGDIPVDATTQYVDQSFTGTSTGSSDAPWTTIGDAVTAAPPNGLIAVAAGSYHEDVLIQLKPLRLHGVCPAQVAVVGTGAELAALRILQFASGSEVRGLAVRGAAVGVQLNGSEQVLFDRLWVHDNASRGINVSAQSGPTSGTVRASLIEQNHEQGVYVSGSEVTVEATAVRGTQLNAQGLGGRGISIEPNFDTNAPSTATVRASVVEQNHDVGVFVFGSEATVEATVVRGTQLNAQGLGGHGILMADPAMDAPLTATVRASLVEQNHEAGVSVAGSEVTVETTVVRGTLPNGQGVGGRGINIQPNPATGAPSTATVRTSLVEQNHDVGVFVFGSEATVETTVVRGTLPDGQGHFGRGINVSAVFAPASCTVRASLIEQNHDKGVFIDGSEATVEATVVRGTLPDAQGLFGHGIVIQLDPDTGAPSTAMVRASLVEQNHEFGVAISVSEATVEATVVRGTQPDAQGLGGLGIAIFSDLDTGASSTATVRASLVEQNHDVGVLVAGSEATVEATVVRGTQPTVQGLFGRGIVIRPYSDSGTPSTATVRASLVEQNHEVGVLVFGSEATVESTVVRGTQPNGQGLFGRGINIQPDPDTGAPSIVTVRASLVEQNHDIGMFVSGSEVAIEDSHIVTTRPNGTGSFGDGVLVSIDDNFNTMARVFVDNTHIDDSARAGLSNFGGFVSLRAVTIGCAKWQLEGEPYNGHDFVFENRGDNACGCPEANDECVAVSVGLKPPEPIEPSEPID